MDNLVYHYTSIESLKGIIREDKVTFWATRYGYLNDPFEKIWSQKYIQSLIKNEINVCSDQDFNAIDKLVDRHPYILCFCDIPDYRNMWRLYCNDGLGVCIGVDSCMLSEIAHNNLQTTPQSMQDYFEHVYYCSRKDVPTAVKYWQSRSCFDFNENDHLDNLYPMSAFIKCDDFDIENEVRYARMRENSCVSIGPDTITSVENKNDVMYRMRDIEPKIVPYLEIDFRSDIIKKIIIGYRYNFDDAKDYIRQILSKNSSLSNVRIEKSTLND